MGSKIELLIQLLSLDEKTDNDEHVEKIEKLIELDPLIVNCNNGKDKLVPILYLTKYTEFASSVEILKILIKWGADVNYSCMNGTTPVMYACYFNRKYSIPFIEHLLLNGADINAVNEHGSAAIHFACISNKVNYSILKFLIDNGADAKIKTNKNNTVLSSLLCKYKKFDENIIDLLVSTGLDINSVNFNGCTALHYACVNYYKDVVIVKKILSYGANPNIFVNRIKYVLFDMICVSLSGVEHLEEKKQVIKLLLDNGANVNVQIKENNANSIMALSSAEDNEHSLSITKMLLEKNPKLELKCSNNSTLLLLCTSAIYCGIDKFETIKMLIDYGANFNVINDNDETPMKNITYCKYHDKKIDLVKYLVSKGFDINSIDQCGRTWIHYSIVSTLKEIDNTQFTKELIALGADINCLDKNNYIPLVYAVKSKELELSYLDFLIEMGSNINFQIDNNECMLFIAMHYCKVNDRIDILERLIIKGMDVNHLDKDGNNALFVSLSTIKDKKSREIFRLLLKSGININYIYPIGETILSFMLNICNLNLKPIRKLLLYILNFKPDFSIRYKNGCTILINLLFCIDNDPKYKKLLCEFMYWSKNYITFEADKGVTAYDVYRLRKFTILDKRALRLLKGKN